jgi:hypothetical protein
MPQDGSKGTWKKGIKSGPLGTKGEKNEKIPDSLLLLALLYACRVGRHWVDDKNVARSQNQRQTGSTVNWTTSGNSRRRKE